jgi:hypothetical protein
LTTWVPGVQAGTQSSSELAAAWKDAVSHSRSGRAILEEYLDGPEFSLDAIVHSGTITIRGIADRHIHFEPYFIEMGHTMPTAYGSGNRQCCCGRVQVGHPRPWHKPGGSQGRHQIYPQGCLCRRDCRTAVRWLHVGLDLSPLQRHRTCCRSHRHSLWCRALSNPAPSGTGYVPKGPSFPYPARCRNQESRFGCRPSGGNRAVFTHCSGRPCTFPGKQCGKMRECDCRRTRPEAGGSRRQEAARSYSSALCQGKAATAAFLDGNGLAGRA